MVMVMVMVGVPERTDIMDGGERSAPSPAKAPENGGKMEFWREELWRTKNNGEFWRGATDLGEPREEYTIHTHNEP